MSAYVVIGAKGGTGAEIVKRLLEKPVAEVGLCGAETLFAACR